MLVISFVVLSLLISCSDDPVKPVVNGNLITVQLLDSATNKPMINQGIAIYYALEKTADSLQDTHFTCSPNPSTANFPLQYYLPTKSSVKITLNDAINDSLIKIVYTADNLALGTYCLNVNTDSIVSGIYKAKLFINNTFAQTITLLKSDDYFVLLAGQQIISYRTPLLTLFTDANGNAVIDMTKFRFIGQRIIYTYMNGVRLGIFEVINGFQALAPIDNGRVNCTAVRTIRLSECINNKFVWNIGK